MLTALPYVAGGGLATFMILCMALSTGTGFPVDRATEWSPSFDDQEILSSDYWGQHNRGPTSPRDMLW